jgi:hypothetical protein
MGRFDEDLTSSTNERVMWIMERLMLRLDPQITGSGTRKDHNCINHDGLGRSITSSYLIATCSFENTNIKTPFPEITLKIDESFIVIRGKQFVYRFPPEHLITIYERLKIATNERKYKRNI